MDRPLTKSGQVVPPLEPLVSMTILDFQKSFVGGSRLRWEFQIDAVDNDQIIAVENSVLWSTSGKGDEDIGVHFFERRVSRRNECTDLMTLRRYETVLPQTPVSYDGFLLKIDWLVRVRVFVKGGKEFSEEIPFELLPATAMSANHQGIQSSVGNGSSGNAGMASGGFNGQDQRNLNRQQESLRVVRA